MTRGARTIPALNPVLAAAMLAVGVAPQAAWPAVAGNGRIASTNAAAASLPIRDASSPNALPALRGDRIEIQLDRGAASRALGRTARTTTQARLRIGVPAIDAAASAAGALSFEPEFPGETAPPPGSGEPDFTSFYVVRLVPGASLDGALAAFRTSPGVMSAGAIPILRMSATPNDSLWSQSWWYYDAAGRNDVHAPEAWDLSKGDSTIVVGIIDTGVIPYHPDLGGLLPGDPSLIWTNWAEATGLPGVDDDGNGYVDDVHGWDFVDAASSSPEFPPPDPRPGEDVDHPDNDPNDYAGHGTAVAGLVGALTDNTRGIAGTNWSVRLMPLRVGWADVSDADGAVDMVFAAQALRYATRMHANVVNCSFQTLEMHGLQAAATAAIRAGVVIVAAAGNGDVFHDLQNREDVIAVAATDQDDKIASFSNLGDWVDLAAPGDGVGSTFVQRAAQPAADSLGNRQPSYALGLRGTSFSSPLVAGGVALMMARERAVGAPPLRAMEALFRMSETADDISAPNPGVEGFGGGRLNLVRALTEDDVSFAVQGGSAPVGAPAVLGTLDLSRRIVVATNDARLLFLNGVGDTVRDMPLPGVPIGSPAAADMGGGHGAGIFVAIVGGILAGFDGLGQTLPGWPVSVADQGVTFAFSPVLADVDGDGARDVVCATSDGAVQAFDWTGTPIAPFPIGTDGSGIAAPIAVAELDTVPGADIVVAVASGKVYALHAKASNPRLAGWPKAIASPHAPLIARLTGRPTPCIAVASGNIVRLYEVNGGTRMDLTAVASPPGTIVGDPIAADLDGDGYDEIVVPVAGPDGVASLDSLADAATWSRTMPGVVGSPIVRGHGGSGADGAQVFVPVNSLLFQPTIQYPDPPRHTRFRALDGAGNALATFPKAGAVTGEATAFGVDSLGTARLLAGGVDSLVFFYKVPRPVLAGDPGWFTARADFARTGSRMTTAPLAVVDDPPGRVQDLAAIAVSDTSVTLRWTAPGNVGGVGRPRHYDVRAATRPIDDLVFEGAPFQRIVLPTVDPGGVETYVFGGLAPGTHYYFALVPFRLPRSNQTEATTSRATGVALAVRATPSRLPVEFTWRGLGAGTASQTLRIFDLSGRRVRDLPLGAGASGTLQWNGRDDSNELVPAGIYFARLTSGSVHAQARVVLLP